MNITLHKLFALTAASIALVLAGAQPAFADEAAIRKNIAERIPNLPKIDEVSKTPIAGIYEIRFGSDVMYTDEMGGFIIEGQLIDTKTRDNLTKDRIGKLTAIDFKALPLQDAMVWKQGTGARKLVVFADPNCGYCKKFERDLQQVKDVTVYTFLYPILGGDSPEKSKAIWCAKDNTKAWRDWMINGVPVAASTAPCDTSALVRNAALGKKYRIDGTPGLVFEDGKKQPGALDAEQIEKQLLLSKAAKVSMR